MSHDSSDLIPETDILGAATPGSYGMRPPSYRLPDDTQIGGVILQVSDLVRSREFYERTLGFRPITVSADRVTLGSAAGDRVLIELVETRNVPAPARRKALGLFHVAILLPSRSDLGRFLRHLEQQGVRAGAGDHLVSEALYLQDPDDLGIEVYADRPKAGWRRRGRELVLATEPVDTRGLLAAGGATLWNGIPAGTRIGHVHLHVGALAAAEHFYSGAVGLDRMVWSYPGALFLAAGGYHHHLGTNVWAGAGAQPAEPDAPQLLEWSLELPSPRDVEQVAESLRGSGYDVDHSNAQVLTRDPWGTALRLRVADR